MRCVVNHNCMLEMLKFVFSLKSYFTKLKVGYFSFLLTFITFTTKRGSNCFFFFFSGYNCSLFAYGQTGSGKSYSMVGYGKNRLVL